jgi:hypothetical protein
MKRAGYGVLMAITSIAASGTSNAAAIAPLPELIVANPYTVTPAGVYSPHVQSTIQHHERRVREHYRQHHQYKYKHN